MVPEYCPVQNTEYSQEPKGSAVSYIPSIVGMAQAWVIVLRDGVFNIFNQLHI